MSGRTVILFLVMVCCCIKYAESADKKNVLLIIIDDFRPEIGVYTTDNDTDEALYSAIQTPHIDQLAEESIRFKNAFSQYPSCGPSRASFLSGRRPDTTGVTKNKHNFRNTGGDFTTLPQYFKENGYLTYGSGKVFHTGHDDNTYSWTENNYQPGPTAYWHKTTFNEASWGAADDADTVTRPLPDMDILTYAKSKLDSIDAHNDLFFMAVGFKKPHLPFICPASWFDLYNETNIDLPKNPHVPENFPDIAWAKWLDLHEFSDMVGYDNSFNQTTPDNVTIALRHAYYACASYTDDLVGQLLEKLKQTGLDNNTVVALISDHGFHLGEHSHWTKASLFNLDNHIPMLLKVPGITDNGGKLETSEFVELIDIFPTLVDAAGLDAIPQCSNAGSDSGACHEGLSAYRFINETGKLGKKFILSQYKRGGTNKMGYSIRDKEYHYVRWVSYPGGSPNWSNVEAEELYDLAIDPNENINIAHDPAYNTTLTDAVIADLFAKLQNGYRDGLPDVI